MAQTRSRKGLLIGGIVVGAIAIAGFRKFRNNKSLETPKDDQKSIQKGDSKKWSLFDEENKNNHSFGDKKDSKDNYWSLFDRKGNGVDKYQSKDKHSHHNSERPLTDEAKKMFDDLRSEATQSYEKLKHDSEEKTKQFNQKLISKAQELKTGAEDKTRAIQKDIEQQMQEFKEDADNAIKTFQKEIEDRAKEIRQKASGMRDDAMDGLQNLSKEARETALKWKKDLESYMNTKIKEAKDIMDKNFPD